LATASWSRLDGPLRALNAICPYYTMFPLEFPLRTLARRARHGDWVADPFCGRGTTNFATRLLGLPSIGVDSSPVAVALTRAKLASARAADVVRVAQRFLDATPADVEVPAGEFWELAFDPKVLGSLCWLRAELLRDCASSSRILLRAILLGALHGPRTKHAPSHLSNQCPRTYAPKPDYAARFWRAAAAGRLPAAAGGLTVVAGKAAASPPAAAPCSPGATACRSSPDATQSTAATGTSRRPTRTRKSFGVSPCRGLPAPSTTRSTTVTSRTAISSPNLGGVGSGGLAAAPAGRPSSRATAARTGNARDCQTRGKRAQG
jgi:DNA methylase